MIKLELIIIQGSDPESPDPWLRYVPRYLQMAGQLHHYACIHVPVAQSSLIFFLTIVLSSWSCHRDQRFSVFSGVGTAIILFYRNNRRLNNWLATAALLYTSESDRNFMRSVLPNT